MSLAEKIALEFEAAEKQQTQSSELKMRKEAFSAFQRLGIPGNRHEEWRYTNIKTKLPESLSVAPFISGGISKSGFHDFENIKANKLVFVNGNFDKKLSNIVEQEGL